MSAPVDTAPVEPVRTRALRWRLNHDQRFRMLHPGVELLDSFDRIRVDDDDTERMDEELLRKKG